MTDHEKGVFFLVDLEPLVVIDQFIVVPKTLQNDVVLELNRVLVTMGDLQLEVEEEPLKFGVELLRIRALKEAHQEGGQSEENPADFDPEEIVEKIVRRKVDRVPVDLPEFVEKEVLGVLLFLLENLSNELLPKLVGVSEDPLKEPHQPKVLSMQIDEVVLLVELLDDYFIGGLLELLQTKNDQSLNGLAPVNLISPQNQLKKTLDVLLTFLG